MTDEEEIDMLLSMPITNREEADAFIDAVWARTDRINKERRDRTNIHVEQGERSEV
jgi:hypothetical protein